MFLMFAMSKICSLVSIGVPCLACLTANPTPGKIRGHFSFSFSPLLLAPRPRGTREILAQFLFLRSFFWQQGREGRKILTDREVITPLHTRSRICYFRLPFQQDKIHTEQYIRVEAYISNIHQLISFSYTHTGGGPCGGQAWVHAR